MRSTALRAAVSRRQFLRQLFLTAGAASSAGLLSACGLSRSEPRSGVLRSASRLAEIGPLGEPDGNGIRLPAGFGSRVVAVSGEDPTGASGYLWHPNPDGGATFAAPDGGWVYVCNSESTPGGVGALRFDAQGRVVHAYRILDDTRNNCAGGKTPWNTWLSCEEVQDGMVYECDPFGTPDTACERPALGVFNHEAVAVDPQRRHLYLTEDSPVGRLYRFVPDAADWPEGAPRPELERGRLQALQILGGGAPTAPTAVLWHDVPEPQQPPVTLQVPQATVFNGGEGIWYWQGIVFFTTKGDNRVWAYDAAEETIEIIYDLATSDTPILSGVDNVVVSNQGDVLVAEDGGDMQVCVITPERKLLPLLQIAGQDGSEVTGPAFAPDGRRLYVNSQRGARNGAGTGITYEILFPFET